MRIAILTTSYPDESDDAAGACVANEAALLVREGHDVTVLAPGRSRRSDGPPRVIRLGGGSAFGWPGALERLKQRPWHLASVVSFAVRAARELRLTGYDRVIAHWIVPSAWPIAWMARMPLEIVSHGSDVRLLRALPRTARSAILRALLQSGARFRFVSTELRDELASDLGSELIEASSVQPCPIDVSQAPARSDARERLGIRADERLVLVVGRLLEAKRVDVALGAALLLPRARVVVVGDGPLRASLQARFPDVTFAGKLPHAETLTWLAAADLLVSASRLEGAPTNVREARALGVPVVAAPCGDLSAWARNDTELYVVRAL